MQVFDTSSIVYAWDNYPIQQFPSLWRWMAIRLAEKKICMPEVAIAEIASVSPECRTWLIENEINSLPMTDAILQDALRIKNVLQIGVRYGPGVGENDLLIIATAKTYGVALVTNEARQPIIPAARTKYKMPAVCSLPEVAVECYDFLEFLRLSKAIFQ